MPYFLLSLQCPSRNESYRLDGTSHPSGSRSAEKRELLLCDPCPFSRTQKIFGSRPCPNGGSQNSWLLANLSWLTTWAVKTLMTLWSRGGTDNQSDFVVFHQPLCVVHRSSPLLIRITFLVERALDPSSHSKLPEPACVPKHCGLPPNWSSASSDGNRPGARDKIAGQNPMPPNTPTLNIYYHSFDFQNPSAFHYSSIGWEPSDHKTHSPPRSQTG
jgi:hypothetical protein